MFSLIIATRNQDKMKEIRAILKGLNIKLYSLLDFDEKIKIEENGSSFCQNASLKAEKASKILAGFCLGEDSGLSVDYLGGRPGIYSARFAGENCTYSENNQKLLKELAGVPAYKRRAKFTTCLALAKDGKTIELFEGSIRGMIAFMPRGNFGFGYDPLFYLPRYKKTMAELKPEIKNKISHRYRALLKFRNYLKKNLRKLQEDIDS